MTIFKPNLLLFDKSAQNLEIVHDQTKSKVYRRKLPLFRAQNFDHDLSSKICTQSVLQPILLLKHLQKASSAKQTFSSNSDLRSQNLKIQKPQTSLQNCMVTKSTASPEIIQKVPWMADSWKKIEKMSFF